MSVLEIIGAVYLIMLTRDFIKLVIREYYKEKIKQETNND